MIRIILIFLIGFASLLNASESVGKKYKLGLLMGIQSSYLSTNNPINYKYHKATFLPALIFDCQVSENWSIRTGMTYSIQGGNSKDYPQTTILQPEGTGKFFWFTSSISYLEIPLNINYKLNLLPIDLVIGMGPTFGYLLSAYTYMEADFKIEEDFRDDISNKLNKLNFIVNTSIFTTFKISDNIFIEIGSNFSNGLFDIFNEKLIIANNTLPSEEQNLFFKTRSVNFFMVLTVNL